MKLKYFISAAILPLLLMIAACDPREDPQSALRDALTFHASFDNGVNADFANGDPVLYTATAVRPELRTRAGLPEEVSVTQGEGQFGNCLSFNPPDDIKGTRTFYKLKDNLPYKTEDWAGTISFWLRVTPDEDLRPGYTDPIQLTPRSALDGCLWVDFDLSEERVFRMGAFPDKKY
ncbi:MAG: hypothetical protein O7C75_20425, partial [Verrucomicrobia bacterium]|nr:hypothetical protein [Verrucomicrobiota bacterium]